MFEFFFNAINVQFQCSSTLDRFLPTFFALLSASNFFRHALYVCYKEQILGQIVLIWYFIFNGYKNW